GELSEAAMHFGVDSEVLKVLTESKDETVRALWTKMCSPQEHYALVGTGGDWVESPKFRGIDQLDKTADGLKRLTAIDPFYHQMYEHNKALCNRGWRFQWKVKTSPCADVP